MIGVGISISPVFILILSLGYQDSNLEVALDQNQAGCLLPYTPLYFMGCTGI